MLTSVCLYFPTACVAPRTLPAPYESAMFQYPNRYLRWQALGTKSGVLHSSWLSDHSCLLPVFVSQSPCWWM